MKSLKKEIQGRNLGNRSLLKSKRLVLEVFALWKIDKDRLKVASYISEKYSLLLSRNQIDSIIRKGRKVINYELQIALKYD